MSARVSVIIPTYNYARFIAQAVDSALAQALAPAEIIVVNDGSTDNTLEVLAPYADRIRVITQANAGVAAARNRGAAAASGDYFAFLDSDDVWLPQKLERQMAAFTADAELGMVHCGLQDIDGTGQRGAVHLDGMAGSVSREMLFHRRPVILGGGSGAVFTRRAFEAAGGYDTEVTPSEDWDMWYRVACRYKVGFLAEVLLLYRFHGNAQGHRNIGRMSRGVLRAYEKAFRGGDPELAAIRRQCYGNLHRMIAASFFGAGDYRNFAAHAMKSIFLAPGNVSYFLQFPVRRLRRWGSAQGGNSHR